MSVDLGLIWADTANSSQDLTGPRIDSAQQIAGAPEIVGRIVTYRHLPKRMNERWTILLDADNQPKRCQTLTAPLCNFIVGLKHFLKEITAGSVGFDFPNKIINSDRLAILEDERIRSSIEAQQTRNAYTADACYRLSEDRINHPFA